MPFSHDGIVKEVPTALIIDTRRTGLPRLNKASTKLYKSALGGMLRR